MKRFYIPTILVLLVLLFAYYEPQLTKSVQSPSVEKPNLPLLLTNEQTHFPENQQVDEVFNKFLNEWGFTGGFSVAIAKDGKLVYAKGFGYADAENKELLQPYHLLRTASVSKLITAIAIMKLVETGKLKLTDKVFGQNGILKDSISSNPKDANIFLIEVQHLLTHTGGFRNIFRTDPMFIPLEVAKLMKQPTPPTLETTMAFMLSQKNLFTPGSLHDYSNFGYSVLGKVIEAVAQKPYEKYVQDEILKPLGITQMCLGKNLLENRFPNEVKYYEQEGAMKKLSIYGTGDSVSAVYGGNHIEAMGAAGGWLASPVDLVKLVLSIDNFSTQPDILSKESIDLMTNSSGDTISYIPIGWRLCNEIFWIRTGSYAGTSAVVSRQNDGYVWAIVTNQNTWRGSKFHYDLRAVMRRALAAAEKWHEQDLFKIPQ